MKSNPYPILALLLCLSGILSGQDYIVQGTSPDLYLTHQVKPKETWYALGRKYNLPPADIAAFNGHTLSAGLEIGQQLKVPLRAANFSQDGRKDADEVLVPLYHVVAPREWMYRISVNHNKVPVEYLERWNNMRSEDVKAGQRLIVGHLRVKREHAALAHGGARIIDGAVYPAGDAPALASRPVPVAESVSAPASAPRQQQPEAVPASRPQPVSTPTSGGASAEQSGGGGPGYFRSLYAQTGGRYTGVAGVFRSTSGWKDGKYYALMSNVTVGSIVKIVNPANNKHVYAKVLGELPDMKESAGLMMRISDAAANELGVKDSRFTVEVLN